MTNVYKKYRYLLITSVQLDFKCHFFDKLDLAQLSHRRSRHLDSVFFSEIQSCEAKTLVVTGPQIISLGSSPPRPVVVGSAWGHQDFG